MAIVFSFDSYLCQHPSSVPEQVRPQCTDHSNKN